MSYGFDLFRVPPGEDPLATYREQLRNQEARALERMEGVDNMGPIDPSKEGAKRLLGEALMARHPGLKLAERDYGRIARTKSVTENDARRKFRHLELNDLELGLQVMLFDDTAAVTIPFWRLDKERAESTLRAAWKCLEILELEGGFSTYDPQAGHVLKLDSDFDATDRPDT